MNELIKELIDCLNITFNKVLVIINNNKVLIKFNTDLGIIEHQFFNQELINFKHRIVKMIEVDYILLRERK